MHKLATFLAVIATVGALSSYARDLDEGTVEDDGSGGNGPNSVLHFTPDDSRVFLKLYNPNSQSVTLNSIYVKLAEEGEGDEMAIEGLWPDCSSYDSVNAEPLRTWVTEGSAFSTSGIDLSIEIGSCEVVTIEVFGATPGVEHSAIIRSSGLLNPLEPQLFLKVWDGVCND